MRKNEGGSAQQATNSPPSKGRKSATPGGNDPSQKPPQKPSRERLDMLVVRRGLAPSRERARALIMARDVLVDGRVVDKAGAMVPSDADCALATPPAELRYVSRGGLKLERALDAFALDPSGLVCLDVGASTGGFTDVLLRRGAARVYAVDVGHGQLAWALRTDARVVTMERVNIRHLESLPEPIAAGVIDVSFISLRLVLPAVARLLRPGAWVVALVKPQFEAGRAEVSRGGGIISDPAIHRRVLSGLLDWLREWSAETAATSVSPAEAAVSETARAGEPRPALPLRAQGVVGSPIAGRDGNHEYLLALRAEAPGTLTPQHESLDAAAIDRVVAATLAGLDAPPESANT